MGNTNIGNQIVTFSYGERAESIVFNSLNHKIIPAGIYQGAGLTKVSNTTISIAPGVFVLEDTSKGVTVRVETQSSYSKDNAHPTTPMLVTSIPWMDAQSNYAEFSWRSVVGVQEDDVVLGKVLFSGSTITGFDYSSRDEVSLDNRKSVVWVVDEVYNTGNVAFYEGQWFTSKLDNNVGNTPPSLPTYETSYWINVFGPAPSSTNYISGSDSVNENLSSLDSQVGTNTIDIATHNHDSVYLNESSNLSDLDNVPTARSNLGLGTAATTDTQTSETDVTPGRVLLFGGFGIGELVSSALVDLNSYTTSGRYRTPSGFLTNQPTPASSGYKFVFVDKDSTSSLITQILLDVSTKKVYTRSTTDGLFAGVTWLELVDFTQLIAENVSITDSGSIIAATDVEGALQEIAGKDPTLTLSGKITGSASFTNLGNATLTTSIASESASSDWDNYTATGFYRGNSMANAPGGSTGWFYVLVHNHNSSYTSQLSWELTDSTPQLWLRTRNNGTWEAWQQFARITDNVASASKLNTARTISLTGDVTGSTSFDGSANVSISTTVSSTDDEEVTVSTSAPSGGDDGDVWLRRDGSNDGVHVKQSGTWNELSLGELPSAAAGTTLATQLVLPSGNYWKYTYTSWSTYTTITIPPEIHGTLRFEVHWGCFGKSSEYSHMRYLKNGVQQGSYYTQYGSGSFGAASWTTTSKDISFVVGDSITIQVHKGNKEAIIDNIYIKTSKAWFVAPNNIPEFSGGTYWTYV